MNEHLDFFTDDTKTAGLKSPEVRGNAFADIIFSLLSSNGKDPLAARDEYFTGAYNLLAQSKPPIGDEPLDVVMKQIGRARQERNLPNLEAWIKVGAEKHGIDWPKSMMDRMDKIRAAKDVWDMSPEEYQKRTYVKGDSDWLGQ